MEIGEIVKAKVDQVEQYGVFLSNKSGRIFIQIPELDWVRRTPDAREFTEIGVEFEVLVLAYDDRRKLHSGSIKKAHPELDPYKVGPLYKVGTTHSSTVVLNTEYGTFVETVPGLEALIYNESGGTLKIGSTVQVKVVLYDLSKRRVQVELST